TWQAIRAVTAEATAKTNEQQALSAADAERKAKEAEAQQRQLAEANAKRAEAVAKFLADAFASPSPFVDGPKITVAELLDRSAKDLHDKFADDPRTKAELLHAIGVSEHQLHLNRDAIPILQEACQLRMSALGADHPDTLKSECELCWSYMD